MRTLLLIAIAASLTACHSDLAPPAQRLAGTWSSTYSGAVVELIAGDDTSGVYIAGSPNSPESLYTGRFTATPTEITITNDDQGPCPDLAGRYEYAIMTGVIQFTLQHDECDLRHRSMDDAWVRVFAPDPSTDVE
jgi:hypothetical protein